MSLQRGDNIYTFKTENIYDDDRNFTKYMKFESVQIRTERSQNTQKKKRNHNNNNAFILKFTFKRSSTVNDFN